MGSVNPEAFECFIIIINNIEWNNCILFAAVIINANKL